MKARISLFLCLCILLAVSCREPVQSAESVSSVRILTWNVQNLFNGIDDGSEYEEYTVSGGWKDTYYKARLALTNEVLGYREISSADILVLNEVENQSVVEDLLRMDSLQKRGFAYYAVASEEDGAISLAIVSRFPITDVKIHTFESLRPIIQAGFDFGPEKMFVLAVHAKSRLGDVKETEAMRYSIARALEQISSNLKLDFPGCGIVIAGDFNEGYEDCNMMQDMRLRMNSFSDCPLPVVGWEGTGFWYSLWLDPDIEFSAPGSYFYGGNWESFDNILVKDFKVNSGGVVFEKVLKNTENLPNSWSRQLLSGVSDHLPVWADIGLDR